MIALPVCTAWLDNIEILVSFIKIYGAICTINTENDRIKYQNLFKEIVKES